MVVANPCVVEVFYVLLELQSEAPPAVIVPLSREGESLEEDIYAEDGRPLADLQPGDAVIVHGVRQWVAHIDLYEPADQETGDAVAAW